MKLFRVFYDGFCERLTVAVCESSERALEIASNRNLPGNHRGGMYGVDQVLTDKVFGVLDWEED